MAIAVTAKGSVVTSGATGDSISVTGLTFTMGASAYIFVLSSGGDPATVVWGADPDKRDATKIATVTNSTSGLTLSVWEIRYIWRVLSQDVTATWSATNKERCIGVVETEEASVADVNSSATQDASTAPNTGTAVTSTEADTIQLACFGNNGRTSDTLGTVGEGHTSLTSGGSVAAKTLLHITYEILSATGDVRGSKTGATSRDWCNIVIAFKRRQTFTIKKCSQHHRYMNENPDWVWFTIEDESAQGFEIQIDPSRFDDMSDSEVYAEIARFCAVYAVNIIDDEWAVDSDSARDTRMATFVNDEVTI